MEDSHLKATPTRNSLDSINTLSETFVIISYKEIKVHAR